MRHRKEDSDRGEADENCVFSNLHKHSKQETSRNDAVSHMRDLRSTASEAREHNRQVDECSSRLSDGVSSDEQHQPSSKVQSESAELSANSFHSNVLSDSKFHNVLEAADKTSSSNQCMKTSLHGYQCSVGAESDSDSSDAKDASLTDKVYDRGDKSVYNFSDSVPYDVNDRKSPIHGKAPRNSPFRETQELEGSAGETLESNKQSKITSIEPLYTSEFQEVNSHDGNCNSNYPTDVEDCTKTDRDDQLFTGKLNGVITEDSYSSEARDPLAQDNESSEDFVTKKSEDTRSLTLKRCTEAPPAAGRSRKSRGKKQTDRRAKYKRTKNSCTFMDRCNNVRLTRSQKKESQPQAPTVSIGAADDDSGIQDIYEFSEKESNLEDISLPNRGVHLRDKYNDGKENPAASLVGLDPWRGCDGSQNAFDRESEGCSRADSVSSEEKNNE